MKATRLLKLLPSLRDCLVSLSWVAQGMVAVMRTGLRNASGTTKSRLPCENAVISSIPVELVTGQAVGAALAHLNYSTLGLVTSRAL